MSKAAGAEKPNESQKAKAAWAIKAAKDRRGDEFYDLARKENILGRKQTRLELWEEHLKERGRISTKADCWLEALVELVFNDLWPRGLKYGARVVGQTFVGKGLALFEPVGSCASTHSFHALERLREVRAAWRALFSS